MSLKKCFSYLCALLVAGLLSVAPSSARYPTARSSTVVQTGCQPVTCPPCWGNEAPLDGSGGAPDGSGRRLLNVYIDASWGTPPNENIRAATEEAINGTNGWNNAVDTTCTPPTQKTGYFLKLDQNVGANLRDIVIKRDDDIRACAGTASTIELSTGARKRPDNMFLKGVAANLPHPKLVKLIAHELGHTLGLDNGRTSSNCDTKDIMRIVAKPATCAISNVFDNHRITSADVGQSNRNINPDSRTTCRGDRQNPSPVPATQEECEAEGNHWNSTTEACEEPPLGGGGGGGGDGSGCAFQLCDTDFHWDFAQCCCADIGGNCGYSP